MGADTDVDRKQSRRERSVEMRDQEADTTTRERWKGGYDEMEEDDVEKSRESTKHRSKDRSKSSSRREDKDHRSKDRERSKIIENVKERDKESSRDRRKDDKDEREKEKNRDKVRERDVDRDKYKDKDRKDRAKEKEQEKELEGAGERGRDKERGKEKSKEKDKDREKEKEKDRTKDREREKERDKHKDKEKERDNERERGRDANEREKGKERVRDKEREVDLDREIVRERDRGSRKHLDGDHDQGMEDKARLDHEAAHDSDISKRERGSYDDVGERRTKFQLSADSASAAPQSSISELEERISKMKEERLQKKSEGVSEVLAWVNKSRKLEEKRINEKEKALQLSKVFEEQDNINQEESDDDVPAEATKNLGGVKILHGLDKVLEGGAVVLTLKDQSILADGDINEEVDMLENVEIGEQKRRDEAYEAAKKKGIYDDKFNDEPGSERKILPQYDEPNVDEVITLDSSGRFSGEAEKKLEELRKRIQGVSTRNHFEDLTTLGKTSSDYFTEEEMLQFKKPKKKKKSLRKKEKLDVDALEAEAVAAGLGGEDLGSRKDGKRQNLREEQTKSEAEMRSKAYQAATAKAEEASKALKLGRTSTLQMEEDDAPVIGDDDEDLRKSLERARKLALKKQTEAAQSTPQVIAQLALSTAVESTSDNQASAPGESQEGGLVLTEVQEFVYSIQLNEEGQKPDSEDVSMEEDGAAVASDQGNKEEDGGWMELKETEKEENPSLDKDEEIIPDNTIHEAAVGKGLAGALQLLKDRGSLKQTVEWGGRNMDKKKSKLVGIYDDNGQKEIRIERTDEYGRILTPKEAFRLLSHKFHGKGPGKMKLEKRMRQYQEELKVKQMKNADTPSQSVERMREVQAQLKSPYLVLSGQVKPGQTSDPRSGFATVEKGLPGGLTPMLGDKKVEHFLGLKRKSESGDAESQKKPKT